MLPSRKEIGAVQERFRLMECEKFLKLVKISDKDSDKINFLWNNGLLFRSQIY